MLLGSMVLFRGDLAVAQTTGQSTNAVPVQATGTGDRLWVIVPTPESGQCRLLTQQAQTNDPQRLYRLKRLNAKPLHIAAWQDGLWLLDNQNHIIQVNTKIIREEQLPIPYPDLPAMGRALAMAVGDLGPVVVAQPQPAGTQPGTAPASIQLALWTFNGQLWSQRPVPDVFDTNHPVHLVLASGQSDQPILMGTDRRSHALLLLRNDPKHNSKWQQTTLQTFSPLDNDLLAWIGTSLILARHDGQLLKLYQLEQDKPLLIATIDAEHWQPIRMMDYKHEITILLARTDVDANNTTPELGILRRWTHTPANQDSKIQPLVIDDLPLDDQTVQNTITIIALLLAGVLILLGWHRNPQPNVVQLPDGIQIAPIVLRLIAAIIDMIPVVFIAFTVFSLLLLISMGFDIQKIEALKDQDLIFHLWVRLCFYLGMIGLFSLHTGICEYYFGASMGKLVTGLRVTDVKGQRPDGFALLLRNVFKMLELIGWPMLILPFINANRQRLGDLTARTVVVCRQMTNADATDSNPPNQP